ncbi:hypothetical protein OVA24_16915 [Luteolibacter sp. SL250]|uniref:hypothetical protein n=1 Tax=Luteolibacter sp. SL250 TaxID=2995170 RepID=UPI00226FDB97|nr:hypothetical protein [Luteolibacter sp. SL250]WAC18915.1 hypothetical protein OVA24_16915 [Luteolibacter sp. SL250]
MLRLHLPRALLAAGIALAMCGTLPLLWITVHLLLMAPALPFGPNLRLALRAQPLIFLSFALLLVMLSIPMAVLWRRENPRRTLSIPWMAAVCGACLGILLSPPWYVIIIALHGELFRLSLSNYLEIIHVLVPFSAITGALYFFLHSFFIRQALGKKAWLESRM